MLCGIERPACGSRGCGGFQRFWAGSVDSEGNTKVGCDVGLGAVEVCLKSRLIEVLVTLDRT
jgi:hypothetical protein